ncbi:MAG: hypothetical protein IKJ91_00150 [Clostridia bacterium]|nr:hypothetical protein [Clostridia bacterium]
MTTAYDMQFRLGAQMASTFNSTFGSAQKALSATQKEINELNKTQSNISAYQKQQNAMANCLKQQELYKAQIANLKKELQNLTKEQGQHGAGTSVLANKILELEKKMSSVAGEEERHRQALKNLGNELKEAGVDTKKLGDEIEKVGKKMGDLKKKQDELSEKFEEGGEKGKNAFEQIGEAIAALGILKALEKGYKLIVDTTKGAASYADEIGTLSIQYGMAAEDLQAFSYAAELVDVSQETLTSTMSRNIRAMNSARDGTESYVEAYEKLGVKVTDADGQLRNAETVYWEVIDALGAMENETERDAVAIELLGRSAQQVNTLVEAGSGVIKEYANEAKRAGYVMNDETLAACMALDDEIQRQNSNMTALKNTIGGQLAPEYAKLKELENEALVTLTAFAANHPEIVKGLTAAGMGFGVIAGGAAAASLAVKGLTTAIGLIPGIGPILAIASAVAVVAGVAAASATASKKAEDEYENLTAASRKQALEIKALEDEYNSLVEAGGANTYEAWKLEKQINALNEEYEASKQTIEEHRAQLSAAAEELSALSEEHENAIEAIDNEYESSMALIEKLDELAFSSMNVASRQALIKPIIDELNSRYEGLGLTIDYITGKMNMPIEKLRELALEEYNRETTEAERKAYAENFIYTKVHEAEYEAAKLDLREYEEEYKKAQKEFEQHVESAESNFHMSDSEIRKFDNESRLLSEKAKKAKKAFDDYKEFVYHQSMSDDDPNGIIFGYENAQKVVEAYEKQHSESMSNVHDTTQATISYLEELANGYVETYEKAYEAAYESITGQFDLWENAAEVVPKSISDINNALATQTSYWSDYNKDLSSLLARGEDVEGLADVIASFADGSEASVNAIAGMAAASDEDLRLMVENYNLMKKQQDEAAKSLALSNAEELAEIEDQMKATIENLDLKEEAELAGKNTIEAYVSALRDGSDEAAEYLNLLAGILGDVSNHRTGSLVENKSPIVVYTPYASGSNASLGEWSSEESRFPIEVYTPYATGTLSARSGWSLVGEEGPELVNFGGGEAVFDALNTERAVSAMVNSLSLLSAAPASVSYGGNKYDISVSPTFYVTEAENTSEKLEEYSDIVANEVMRRLSETDSDAKRGAFR